MKLKALVVLALLGCAASGLAIFSTPAFAKQLKLSDLAPGLYGYKDPNSGRYRKYYVPDPKSPEQQISDLKEQPLPDEFLDLVVGKKTDEEDPERAEIEALIGKKKQKKDATESKAEKKPAKAAPAVEDKMEMSGQAPMEMTDQAPAEMPPAMGREPQAVPTRKPTKASKKPAFEDAGAPDGSDGDGFSMREPSMGSMKEPSMGGSMREPSMGSMKEPSMGSMQEPSMGSMKEPSMDSVMKPSKQSRKPANVTEDGGAEDGFFPGEKTVTGGDPFDSSGEKAEKPAKVKPEKVKPEKIKAEKPPKPEKPPKADRPPSGESIDDEMAEDVKPQKIKPEKVKPEKVKPEKVVKEKPPKEKPPKEIADDTGSGDGLSDKVFQAPFAAGGKAGRFFGRGLKKTGTPFSKINGFFFGSGK